MEFSNTRGLLDKYDEIATELENVTRIYKRKDLMLAVDLVYHSVLSFNFQHQYIHKGWLEALIIGDTRTGKTTCIQKMMEHYQAGEIGTGESTSFAGLVGGLQQVNGRWSIQWGKIPLNDRRLFVIDEASGLEQEQIALMSGLRSNGVAEIIKIQTERTSARTRLIWVSNPRRPFPLTGYPYGVYAVRELMGKPEDIARLDFVVAAASGDVGMDVFNAPIKKKPKEPIYTSEICHNLVLWAWSRETEQVNILPETEEAILHFAQIEGEMYSSKIPIVEAAEQRIVLARMSVAAAARFYSTTNGSDLIVRPEHAEFVHLFLKAAYSKPSLDYEGYSEVENNKMKLFFTTEIDKEISDENVQFIFQFSRIRLKDLENLFNDRDKAKDLMQLLLKSNSVEDRAGNYYKTPAFNHYLKERMRVIKGEQPNPDDEVPF